MKKVFRMEDLDCANCAAKMENAVRKIEGVEACTVNFMTQKMTLECAEDRMEEIFKKAVAACRKVDPDCTIMR